MVEIPVGTARVMISWTTAPSREPMNGLGPTPDQFPSWVGFQFGFETWNEVNPGNQFNLSVKYTEAPSPNPGWSGAGVTGFRNAINNDLVTIISGIAHADNQMSLDVYADDWETLYHQYETVLHP